MKHASTPTGDIPGPIRAAAADWLGLRDRGLDASQAAEFLAWLEADERHANAFAEIDHVWDRFDRLETERPATGEPDADLLLSDAAENRTRSTKAAGRWGRPRRFIVPLGIAAAVALLIGSLTWWSGTRGSAAVRFATTTSTEVGGSKTLNLPDGSTVRLNTDTALEVAFTAAERHLRLVRGEAHFDVAKNPARPFVVSAHGVNVRAVGTAFNVRMDAAVVVVLVTEGKVRVDEPLSGQSLLPATAGARVSSASPAGAVSSRRLLGRGERATLSLAPVPLTMTPATITAVSPEENERALAWQQGRLEFAATPLTEAIAQFNRHNRHQLIIDDPRLNELTFGGTFRCDGYEAFVRLLESHFGVIAERQGAQTRLRRAP